MAETQLLHITDHADRATARLLVRWDKPRIRALVCAMAEGAQVQEDDTFNLISGLGPLDATGDLLDKWGELVGEPRGGLQDVAYRQMILARMLANRCDGTINALMEVLLVATGPESAVRYVDDPPAGFRMASIRPDFMDDLWRRRVARMMEGVRPAARSMLLVEAVIGYFGWEGDDEAEGPDVGLWSKLLA